MPIYDYECPKCFKKIEIYYSTHNLANKHVDNEECPKCNSIMKKIPSNVSKPIVN